MKIGIMARILSYDGYGVKTYLRGILDELLKIESKHDIVLFLGKRQKIPKKYETNFRVIRLNPDPVTHLGRFIWDHFSVGIACIKSDVDILFAPLHVRPMYSPCPVVVTIHDMLYHLFPEDWGYFEQLYFNVFVKKLTTISDGIVVDSLSTAKDVKNILKVDSNKIDVIYPGVPNGYRVEDKAEVHRVRVKHDLPEKYILYVGSFHPRKNVEVAIEAFETVCSEVPHQFLIVSNPIWRREEVITRINRSPHSRRFKFLGYVPDKELPYIYNAAELFVFPSKYEGFGFPVLEAMACGVPVISTNSSSIPEVCGEACVLIPPNDIDSLASEMKRVLLDQVKQKVMAESGISQASKFSWAITINKLLQLFERYGRSNCDYE